MKSHEKGPAEPVSGLAAAPILAFADYRLDARRRLLIGPDGEPVDISARAFATLHFLASHPHELIDKQRLMKAVWPHSVVEENNLNQQISAVRKALGEAAGEHKFIVTVTGQGYRFVQDVEQLEALPADPGTQEESGSARPRRFDLRLILPAAAAVALMLVTVFLVRDVLAPQALQRGETPSIAVLPFADMSPNRDQGYFADGLSEELLNALGRLNNLRVIGRTSSFSFKGKSQDARQVADALGVQYILEGSVRRDGDRLRITAQLVDAPSGSQLWAGTFDRRLGDVFEIQKQIAESVAGTLRLTLRPGRVADITGGTGHLEAYETYLAARAVMNNGGSAQAGKAIELLERAVQLDPDFALAWAALAESYTFAMDFPPSSASALTPEELHRRISKAALRAFELAPDAPETLRAAGMVSMKNRDWAEAERRLQRAVELAGPYDYDANYLYAWFLTNVGRVREAFPYAERAIRAEPLLMRPVVFLAALHEMQGDFARAERLLAGQHLKGDEMLRLQGQIMIGLAREDRNALRRLTPMNRATLPYLDDPAFALEELRKQYAEVTRSGALGQLVPVAIFASFLDDHALALEAMRALVPTTQNLHSIWRPVHAEVRKLPAFAALVRDLGLVDYWRASGNWGEFCRESTDGEITCR